MKKYNVTRGCTFCGTCLFECPRQAITLGKEGAVINQKICIGCGQCYENCASEAIELLSDDTNGKPTSKQPH